jgi:hypothetical protein
VRNPWALVKSLWSRFLGDNPQREQRWFAPYNVTGLALSADETLSLSAVWACVTILASALGPMRWKIYQPVPGTKKRDLLTDDWKTWMLNTRPNPEMTAIAWRESMLFQALTRWQQLLGDRHRQWPAGCASSGRCWSDRMRVRRDENWNGSFTSTPTRTRRGDPLRPEPDLSPPGP